VITDPPAADPAADPPAPDPLEMAWALVPPRDRRLFHEFCCENQQTPEHMDAMERISAILQAWL
jgi:hypothetical protein